MKLMLPILLITSLLSACGQTHATGTSLKGVETAKETRVSTDFTDLSLDVLEALESAATVTILPTVYCDMPTGGIDINFENATLTLAPEFCTDAATMWNTLAVYFTGGTYVPQ